MRITIGATRIRTISGKALALAGRLGGRAVLGVPATLQALGLGSLTVSAFMVDTTLGVAVFGALALVTGIVLERIRR